MPKGTPHLAMFPSAPFPLHCVRTTIKGGNVSFDPFMRGNRRYSCSNVALILSMMGASVWALPAQADCLPDASGSVITCTGTTAEGFIAEPDVEGLTVNIETDAIVQANTAENPSVAVQVNSGNTITNNGLVENNGGTQPLNYGINLAGSDNLLTNNGTISLTISADDITNALPGIVIGTRALRGIITTAEDEPFENVQVINNGTVSVQHAGVGAADGVFAGENIGRPDHRKQRHHPDQSHAAAQRVSFGGRRPAGEHFCRPHRPSPRRGSHHRHRRRRGRALDHQPRGGHDPGNG